MVNKKTFFLISFIEGASVMAAEICGAKLLAPFFGSSLYVWSSVMAITLGGLASGYFLGGQISKKPGKERNLFFVLLIAVCALSMMPTISKSFYFFGNIFSLIPAVILSVFVLLFPAMLCMGATSPLLISLLTVEAENSGSNSGKVYAISTVGGILATFLCGFYLIPTVGISYTLICFSIPLAFAAAILLYKKKSKQPFLILLIPVCYFFLNFINKKFDRNCVYKTEGILGTLEVRDELYNGENKVYVRQILINNIIQTEMDLLTKESVSDYLKLAEKNLKVSKAGKALILGLGGGVLPGMFNKHKYDVAVVEFDQRIIDVAKEFFYLSDSIKTYCDDARHFINNSNETYQIIFLDIFKGEEQPSHVITKESIAKLKTMLDTNGVIVVNTHGYINSPRGRGTQCMIATLKKAGFRIKVCATGPNEEYRNLLIYASLKPFKDSLVSELKPLILQDTITINEDNKPVLEKLNADASKNWRSNYIKNQILFKQ